MDRIKCIKIKKTEALRISFYEFVFARSKKYIQKEIKLFEEHHGKRQLMSMQQSLSRCVYGNHFVINELKLVLVLTKNFKWKNLLMPLDDFFILFAVFTIIQDILTYTTTITDIRFKSSQIQNIVYKSIYVFYHVNCSMNIKDSKVMYTYMICVISPGLNNLADSLIRFG